MNPLPKSSRSLLLRLWSCRNKVLDTVPPKSVTSFVDDTFVKPQSITICILMLLQMKNKYNYTLFDMIKKVRFRTNFSHLKLILKSKVFTFSNKWQEQIKRLSEKKDNTFIYQHRFSLFQIFSSGISN